MNMHAGNLQADPAAVRAFLEIINDQATRALNGADQPGLLQLVRIHPNGGEPVASRFAIGAVDRMTEAALGDAASGHNVYIEARTVANGTKRRGKLADTRGVFAFVIDADADKGKAGIDIDGASLAVETSPGNCHRWLFLDKALSAEEARPIGDAIRAATAADSPTGSICQPYRVAGTPNFPDGRKAASGRVCTPTRILEQTGALWTPEALLAAFPPKPRSDGSSRIGSPGKAGHFAHARIEALVSEQVADRSQRFFAATCAAVEAGMTLDELEEVMRRHPEGCAAKYLEGGDRLREELERAWPKAANGHDVEEGRGPSSTISSSDFDVELRRLAALGAGPYERERRDAAQRLGIRASALDRLVASEKGDDQRERGLDLPEAEPWPEPVNGAEVLNDITVAIREHLVVSQHAAEAMALWVVHAHAHDAALISARLAITSPTKRCGKTTTLQVAQALVPRPLPAANITAAALFRAVEAGKPTLLIDEADTFLRNSDELRGILNSGHNRATAYVIRTTGEDHTPTQFRTWAPVAVAMIGDLPGTLADRSIIIEMQRKKAGDTVRRFRSDRTEEFAVLARKAARWAEDTFEDLKDWDGHVPERLHDRAADNWRPLLAIADAAGGDWRTRARAAALALSGVEEDDDEVGVQLLADLKDIFARFGPKVATVTILAQLNGMETRPWPEWKQGKPLTDRQLAKLLKPFKVGPEHVRNGSEVFRGYREDAFHDAFARYVTS